MGKFVFDEKNNSVVYEENIFDRANMTPARIVATSMSLIGFLPILARYFVLGITNGSTDLHNVLLNLITDPAKADMMVKVLFAIPLFIIPFIWGLYCYFTHEFLRSRITIFTTSFLIIIYLAIKIAVWFVIVYVSGVIYFAIHLFRLIVSIANSIYAYFSYRKALNQCSAYYAKADSILRAV